PAVVKQLGNAPVLLISDDRQAVDQGAHLGLLHNDDRVEFEVNLLSLQKSNLRASSQMLKLARTVVR
ncbi:MAG: YfiR family protein, partial [Limnohabitans sp.]